MPGGPIYNGIISQPAQNAGSNGEADYSGVIIPTVLQMSSDALNYWTSLTCLYDRYWYADPNKVTLPICLFNVVKITPVYTVETSKKRIILYEQEKAKKQSAKQLADQFRENVMRTVIDNSVKQPTTYNIEAVVPFQPVGRYITEGIKTISEMISGFSSLLGSAFSSVSSYLGAVETAAELAVGGLGMAGGAMVLGGLVAGPALAIMGFIVGAKASENLDNAMSNHAEAKKIAEELETAVVLCDGIRKRSQMFERLLVRLDALFFPLLFGMETIIAQKDDDWNAFNAEDKKTIAASASIAKVIKTVLDTPILTEEGKLTEESERIAGEVKAVIDSRSNA